MNWRDQAACLGKPGKWFFPTREECADSHAKAKAVCAECPVRQDCLDYAVAKRIDFGMWGGLSEKARGKYRKTGVIPVDRRAGRPRKPPGSFSATPAYLKARERLDGAA